MTTLFISDLHLGTQRPGRLQDFKDLLRGPARDADALYILGDLFEEFWVGNDDITPPNQEIIDTLLEFSRCGVKLYFIRGNRELLLDRGFEVLTGASLLADQVVIDLYGKRVLLMHGDLLCSGDVKYQWYRRILTSKPVQGLIKLLPYSTRSAMVRGLKPLMNRSRRQKSLDIMDVDPATVNRTMTETGVTEIIHGHTHRPAIHGYPDRGTQARRVVLGDWYGDAEILVCENNTRRLVAVSDYLQEMTIEPGKTARTAAGSVQYTTQGQQAEDGEPDHQ